MSHAAALIEAYARRVDAYRTLDQALNTAYEPAARTAAHQADEDTEAARAAADAVTYPPVLALLAYHQVAAPPHDIADLVDAMHDETFSRLAGLVDARDYSNGLFLSLRLDLNAINRVLRSTFGEVAYIFEEEWRVKDVEVVTCRLFWRFFVARTGAVPDPDPNGMLAAFQSMCLSPPSCYATVAPIAGPSRLRPLQSPLAPATDSSTPADAQPSQTPGATPLRIGMTTNLRGILQTATKAQTKTTTTALREAIDNDRYIFHTAYLYASRAVALPSITLCTPHTQPIDIASVYSPHTTYI
ncbi:hypothetical protein GGX14DRAFT_662480 [Mycena pura]|uniref:Uncharacterized protein n=1 Tax=Mycena pura TaxID=153505 RepID=A0AAD6V0R6_9AGAR|nr:hypothetical protein GGX14DRAFT_662480 [Mycena pura]